MNKREILFNKKRCIEIGTLDRTSLASDRYIASMCANIANLGYRLSTELITKLRLLSDESVINLYDELIKMLKKSKGADKEYKPMYPNFPKQVMEASEAELFINAFIHYLTCGEYLPDYKEEVRPDYLGYPELIEIGLAKENTLKDIFESIVYSKNSISESDKEILYFLLDDFEVTKEITYKENLCVVCSYYLTHDRVDLVSKLISSATDVLRLIAFSNSKDISLSDIGQYKFRNFTREDRRIVLSLLNQCKHLEEDMNVYKNVWIKLGEMLHPGDYAKRYPKIAKAFKSIREGKKISTYNGRVDKAFKSDNLIAICEVLLERPTMYARNLNRVLSRFTSDLEFNVVLNSFRTIVDEIPTRVLLQLVTYLKSRNLDSETRMFFLKSPLAKIYTKENNLKKISLDLIVDLLNLCEMSLYKRFANEEHEPKKFYLSEELKNFKIPTAQRSASKSLVTVARGSRFASDKECNYIRPFIWWKGDYIDVDLSMSFHTDDWDMVDQVSYTNLIETKLGVCHSGDITNAPNGACEFLSIDKRILRENNIRYAVMQVYMFSNKKFSELEECFCGYQERDSYIRGKQYEAKTVKNKVDLTAESRNCIPMIYDVLLDQFIWCDLAIKSSLRVNNVEGNKNITLNSCKYIINFNQMSLYDLFNYHIQGNGYLVDDKDKADVVFDLDDIGSMEEEHKLVTPYDLNIIMSEYM